MAAIFGPASLLPRCSQFFLPIAMGRIEFSAQFVDNSMIGWLRNCVSSTQRFSVYLMACPQPTGAGWRQRLA